MIWMFRGMMRGGLSRVGDGVSFTGVVLYNGMWYHANTICCASDVLFSMPCTSYRGIYFNSVPCALINGYITAIFSLPLIATPFMSSRYTLTFTHLPTE